MKGELGYTVGKTYRCDYWRENFTVLEEHDNGDVTVQWHGQTTCGKTYPRKTRHHTMRGRRDVEVLS